MKGFQQGTDLTSMAKSLEIPINPDEKLVLNEGAPKSIKFKGITFHILGPTEKNLEKLREEWKNWLDKKKLNENLKFELLQTLDKSTPNKPAPNSCN
jgi:hypothetical protein